jgi:hypothetical protein
MLAKMRFLTIKRGQLRSDAQAQQPARLGGLIGAATGAALVESEIPESQHVLREAPAPPRSDVYRIS